MTVMTSRLSIAMRFIDFSFTASKCSRLPCDESKDSNVWQPWHCMRCISRSNTNCRPLIHVDCELVVTSHSLSCSQGHTRPDIRSELIFHGRDGSLPRDLWKQDPGLRRDNVAPFFYSRAGEVLRLAKQFDRAIRKITACVCCIDCKHSHVGVPSGAEGERV